MAPARQLALACLLLLGPRSSALEFFVDAAAAHHPGSGTAAAPFSTVAAAVQAVRWLLPATRCQLGGVLVTLAGGDYTGDANALSLHGAADSGCGPGAPLTFRAAPADPMPVSSCHPPRHSLPPASDLGVHPSACVSTGPAARRRSAPTGSLQTGGPCEQH